jgi:hypothetical protein
MISIWDASTCSQIGSLPHLGGAYDEYFLNDGELILLVDREDYQENTLRVWDMEASRVTHELIASWADQIGWTSDSRYVALIEMDQEPTGKSSGTLKRPNQSLL